MEVDRCVKLQVPVPGRDGPRRGTGYRIAPGRILTAAHVVRGSKVANVWFPDASEPVLAKVEWRRPTSDKRPDGSAPPTIDAAVLSFDASEHDTGLAVPLADTPFITMPRWTSRGWAKLARKISLEHPLTGLAGKVYAFGANEPTFEVEVGAPPKGVKDWTGISGAPVIVGSGTVCGVIQRVPKRFGNQRLWATSMVALLRDAKFRQALCLDPAEYVDEARILSFLSSCPSGVRDHLSRHLGCSNEAEDVARVVLGLPWKDCLLRLGELHQALLGQTASVAESLFELLALALPAAYASVRVSTPALPGGSLIELPVETMTLLELEMAGREQRGLAYRAVSDLADEPTGSAKVDLALKTDGGIRHSTVVGWASEDLKEFAQHLGAELRYTNDRRQRLLDTGRDKEYLAGLNRLIERRVRHQAPRYYYVFHRDEVKIARERNVKAADRIAHFVAELRTRLPALHVVELTGGRYDEEDAMLEPLVELLYRANQGDRSHAFSEAT